MPRRNAIKIYSPLSFYHAYNRGVNKQVIFIDEYDYRFFLRLLGFYLSPDDEKARRLLSQRRYRTKDQDLSKTVSLAAYCLMPNHFHLVLKQLPPDGMTRLMRRISVSYSLYFNRRYNRTGHLFESYYKAVSIESDAQLMHTASYVHRNPTALGVDFSNYPYSNFSSITEPDDWIYPELFLQYFDSPTEYASYVNNQAKMAAIESSLASV